MQRSAMFGCTDLRMHSGTLKCTLRRGLNFPDSLFCASCFVFYIRFRFVLYIFYAISGYAKTIIDMITCTLYFVQI